MELRIIERKDHRVSRKDIDPDALKVLNRLKSKGFHAYLAGGCVRDLMLERKPKDFDVVTDATPNQCKRIFSNCRLIGRRFRLAHVHFGSHIVEVATFRSDATDEEHADSPHVQVEEGLIVRDNLFGTPETDALRRDFTVNALFYNIRDFSIIDYVGGMDDLGNRLMRCIGDPDVRYVEDPVRMLRAIRFAAGLGLTIEENSYQAILRNRDQLAMSPPARLYEEMLKILTGGGAEKAFALLRETGILTTLFDQWGAWLDNGASEEDHRWVDHALRLMDRIHHNGRQAPPSLLFSLLFGSYHDAQTNRREANGESTIQAMHHAVSEHHGSFVSRVLMPRRQMHLMRHIYLSRPRFLKNSEKSAQRFCQREYFRDAAVYFKFASRFRNTDHELVTWWEEFLKTAPPPQKPQYRNRPRRRRRR